MRDIVEALGEPAKVAEQIMSGRSLLELDDFIFGLGYLDIRYSLRLSGRPIETLSPGERGALLIAFYLLLESDPMPLIIDQPEENLDNETIYQLLVPCCKIARERRQVIIVTHNPNLAVVSDADQVISCSMDKVSNRVTYSAGAIEDAELNLRAVNVLEGTWPAFTTRQQRYQRA